MFTDTSRASVSDDDSDDDDDDEDGGGGCDGVDGDDDGGDDDDGVTMMVVMMMMMMGRAVARSGLPRVVTPPPRPGETGVKSRGGTDPSRLRREWKGR